MTINNITPDLSKVYAAKERGNNINSIKGKTKSQEAQFH